MTDDLTLEQRVAALLAAPPTWSIDDRRGLRTVAEFRAAEVTALVRAAVADEIRAMKEPKAAEVMMMYAIYNKTLDEAADRVVRGGTDE